jgi:hypothetical protein
VQVAGEEGADVDRAGGDDDVVCAALRGDDAPCVRVHELLQIGDELARPSHQRVDAVRDGVGLEVVLEREQSVDQ